VDGAAGGGGGERSGVGHREARTSDGEAPLYWLLAERRNTFVNLPQFRFVPARMLNLVLNLLAIVVCGALGAGAGYGVVVLAGLGGVIGALIAAFVGMLVATAAWAGGVVALRAVGLVR